MENSHEMLLLTHETCQACLFSTLEYSTLIGFLEILLFFV